jgi:hypothetical protein
LATLGGRPDVVAVHLDDQGDIALCSRQRRVDVLALTGEIGVLDTGEGDVVGTRVETQLTQPVGVDDAGLLRLSGQHLANRRVIGKPGGNPVHAKYSTQHSALVKNGLPFVKKAFGRDGEQADPGTPEAWRTRELTPAGCDAAGCGYSTATSRGDRSTSGRTGSG